MTRGYCVSISRLTRGVTEQCNLSHCFLFIEQTTRSEGSQSYTEFGGPRPCDVPSSHKFLFVTASRSSIAMLLPPNTSPSKTELPRDHIMSIQLFFDFGLVVLFPFFFLASNYITTIIESFEDSTSTSQLLTPALRLIKDLQPSFNLTMSLYLAIAGVLLLVIWVVYIFCVASAPTYDSLWATECVSQTTSPHYYAMTPTEREISDMEEAQSAS